MTDKNGLTRQATVTVLANGALTIVPIGATVNANGNIQFVASGGSTTPSYSFSVVSTTGGTITPTGFYTAGSAPATDTVTLTDGTTSIPTTVNVQATATNVDYMVQTGPSASTGVGGQAVSGYDFVVKNILAAGTQDLKWFAYLSDGTQLNTAGTILLATNKVTGGLGAGATQAIPITGTWPTVPATGGTVTKYLFIQLSAVDDLDSANNLAGPYTVNLSPPDIDYVPATVAASGPGPFTAGSALSGSFDLLKNGTYAGAGISSVVWTAYLSADSLTSISAGDKVVDSGTVAAPLIASTPITFAGTWPAAPGGSFYLKVALSSADDTVTTDNVQVSPVYAVHFINNTVAGVVTTGGTVMAVGQTLNGSFTVENIGNGDGTQPINWTAYVSMSPTLDATASVVAVATTPLIPAGGNRGIGFSTFWPSTPGTYYLIVSISSADDTITGDNISVSLPLVIATATPHYTATSVNNTGGTTTPDGAVDFSFVLTNTSAQNGTQPVSWTVYASQITTLDASAIAVASGTTSKLGAGIGTTASGVGTWPFHFGTYYLIASISVPEDSDPTGHVAATLTAVAVGIYTESEPNDDYQFMVNVNDLPITLNPGVSIEVTGSFFSTSDLHDVFGFNTGMANNISFYLSWGPNRLISLIPFTAPNINAPGVQNPAGTNSNTFGWIPDTHNVLRWIVLQNDSIAVLGSYTLIISAN